MLQDIPVNSLFDKSGHKKKVMVDMRQTLRHTLRQTQRKIQIFEEERRNIP